LILYLFHIFSFLMIFVALVSMIIWLAFYDAIQYAERIRIDLRLLWKSLIKRSSGLFLMMLPSFVLSFVFLSHRKANIIPRHFVLSFSQIKNFLVGALFSFSRIEIYIWLVLLFLIGLILVNVVSIIAGRRRIMRWDGILLISSIYLIIWFIVPDSVSGGTMLPHRVSLFFWLILILWLGTYSEKIMLRSFVQGVAILVCLTFVCLYSLKYKELNDYLKEYVSGLPIIEQNKALLPISFSDKGQKLDGQVLSLRVAPFLHAASYIALKKNIIEFSNYEAATNHFPIKFRSSKNPYIYIGDIEEKSSQVDILGFYNKTGEHVDYVLVWGIIDDKSEREKATVINGQLEKDYNLISSSQRGLMKLYLRRENLE
jgi:hypothetical protein